MDKIKNFFLDFVKTRNIAYYIAAGVTLIAWIAGIISSGALGFAGATALPALLVTLSLIVFVATSLVGHEKIGAALVAAASYGAFVATICEVYAYYLGEIMGQGMTGFDIGAIPGLGALIVSIAMLIVCAIAANVLAFLKLSKCAKKEKSEENKAEVAADESH